MKRRTFFNLGGALLAGSLVPWHRVYSAEAGGKPLRILYFTDLHAMLDRGAPEKMQATAAKIAATPFDLIIGGGDTVHGGFLSKPDEMVPAFEVAKRFLDDLGHPVHLVLGNHDMVNAAEAGPEDSRRFFRELSGRKETFYSFYQSGHRFFILDSVQIVDAPERYHGRVDSTQMDWLRQELSQTPRGMPLVLCSHIPFRSTFLQARNGPLSPLEPNLAVQNANEVLELFAGHNLLVVLQGHLHVNEHIAWNNTHFIMGGAASGAWWQGSNLGTPAGFGIIELGGHHGPWNYLPSGV